MQPEVLRPCLRTIYLLPVNIMLGIVVGAALLFSSFGFAHGVLWMVEPPLVTKALVLAPAVHEEAEPRLLVTRQDGMLWESNVLRFNAYDDVHMYTGMLLIERKDDNGTYCQIRLDPLGGIRQSCERDGDE